MAIFQDYRKNLVVKGHEENSFNAGKKVQKRMIKKGFWKRTVDPVSPDDDRKQSIEILVKPKPLYSRLVEKVE